APPESMVAGDFNRDGRLDLATADGFWTQAGYHTVSVFLGNGDGTLQPEQTFDTGVGSQPNSIIVGDFDGDGELDLATADYGSIDVAVLLGRDDGTIQPYRRFAAGAHLRPGGRGFQRRRGARPGRRRWHRRHHDPAGPWRRHLPGAAPVRGGS